MPAWDDLRYLLAVHRGGNLTSAGARLRVDPTTVGRRVDAFEATLPSPVFVRRKGGWTLTPLGERVMEAAERVERAWTDVWRSADRDADTVRGRVRITTIESIAAHLLAPQLPRLYALHPELEVEVICTPRVLDIARGVADVAIRVGPPSEPDLLARRLARVRERFYTTHTWLASRGLRAEDVERLDDVPMLLTTGRGRGVFNALGQWRCALEANSVPVVVAATAAGLGVALLPDLLAADHDSLVVLPNLPVHSDVPVWLVTHPDLARVPRVRAVLDFLSDAGDWGGAGPPT